MTKISTALLALLACVAAAAPARFSTTTRHDYAIGGGVLKLDVPDEWQGGLAVGATSDASTVQFGNEEAKRFQILLTPMPLRDPKDVEDTVTHAAEQMGPRSIEPKPDIVPFRGAQGPGWYFFATDKQYADPRVVPGPGEYKFLTQGSLLLKNAAVVFTILTNEDSRDVEAPALAMLKRATFESAATT